MEWIVLLFETNRNEKPVENFIKQQQPFTQAKILHQINLLQQYGSQLGMPHSKLIKYGIYELRIRGKEEIRIFYCFQKGTIYLLHALKKKTQKIPQKELSLTFQRKRSL